MSPASRGARRAGVLFVLGGALASSARGQDPVGTLLGAGDNRFLGLWVGAMHGDVDGDGVPDFATNEYGQYIADPYFQPHLSVISGATATPIWTVNAIYGQEIPWLDLAAPVGDADGDGIPDLASAEYDGSANQVVVLRSGVDGHIVRNIVKYNYPDGDRFILLHAVDDLDGDGVRDLVVVRFDHHVLRVFSTQSGVELWHAGWANHDLVFDVTEMGDVDGDGVSDLALANFNNSATVKIRSGATGSVILTIPMSNFPGAFVFGLAVAPLGDISGDGTPDLLVTGRVAASTNYAHLWAVSGADGSLLYETGSTGNSDPWGGKVRSVGDVDGDGFTDVLVGSETLGTAYDVRLLSGATGAEIDRYAPPQPHPSNGGFGFGLCGCGDLDGDGLAEFCIGDNSHADFDAVRAGAVFVHNRKAADPAAGVNAWIVDVHGNGDYTAIQDAINAAADGDLILVRPGVYAGFTLSKRVMIDATSLPFCVAGDVTLDAIAAGTAPAGVSDMFVTQLSFTALGTVTIQDCPGEVVLQRVSCGDDPAARSSIVVLRSPNVALTDCVGMGQPVLTAADSTVRATDLHARCPVFTGIRGADGAPGVVVTGSTLILTRPELLGGAGYPAECLFPYYYWTPPTDGGPAILADASSLTILGAAADYVVGGAGGPAAPACSPTVGDGGDGIDLLNGADVTISRVGLAGGAGNAKGADWAGNGTLTRFDQLPHLQLTKRLRVGRSTDLVLDSVEPGNVLLVVSTVGGSRSLRSFVGPPLSVLPGPGFEIFDLGATDASGQLQLTASLPADLALVGLQFEVQCALFGNSGTDYLSNSVAGEVGL